jgi:hypothetical protein
MSKDDVLKALEEIKQSYAPVTINITPKEKKNASNRGKARSRLLQADEGSDTEIEPQDIIDAD